MHAYCKFKPPSCQKSTTTTKPSQFPKPTCSWSPRAAGLGKLTSHNLPSTKISCISSQFLIQPLPFQSQYWMVWPLANRMNTSHVCQFHAQNDPCYLLEIESKMFEITGCVGVLKLRNVSPILDRFLPVWSPTQASWMTSVFDWLPKIQRNPISFNIRNLHEKHERIKIDS